jgi:hypothetical protein
MGDVISEYQKWKQQGDSLKTQAKHAMETRFRELLAEAVAISEEYRADFGAPLKPSSPVTSFRYKTSAKGKKAAKKPAAPAPAKPVAEARPEPKPQKPDPKVVRLQKKLAAAKKKLEDARSSGAASRLFEDRIYEIEDELRLAGHVA